MKCGEHGVSYHLDDPAGQSEGEDQGHQSDRQGLHPEIEVHSEGTLLGVGLLSLEGIQGFVVHGDQLQIKDKNELL